MGGIVFILGIAALFYVNNHVYKANGFFYYGDIDNDGILNREDLDIDGDAINNIEDTDIDNDGEDNSLDFYKETFSMKGSLYDYTNGVSVEVPLRIGFVTSEHLVERAYANVGIFFGQEMLVDFESNPTGYQGKPSNNEFSSNTQNWLTWFDHMNAKLDPEEHRNEFDILFFESGHVGLLTRIEGEDYVLEADASHLHTTEVLLTTVIEREGNLTAIGRILPKPPEKQY